MTAAPKSPDKSLPSILTFRLARAQNKLNAQATALLKAHSQLSLVEWRILQLMQHFKGASMSRLAAEGEMDKGQFSRNVGKMVEKGLIKVSPSKVDHRRQILGLTDAALVILEKLLPIMRGRQDVLTANATEDELRVFFKVLQDIEKAAELRDMP